jgi:hypothetical protein
MIGGREAQAAPSARRKIQSASSFLHCLCQPSHKLRIIAHDLREIGRQSGHDMLLALLHLHSADSEDRMDELKDVLFGAIDGNALYEIEQASRQLADDAAERAYYARHNATAAE